MDLVRASERSMLGGVLLGPERPRTYDDLNGNEKKRFNADDRATNIVLQGLPKDIYKLINHNIEAKAIWDNVKMLLVGSELTKEDKESQLYDEFERFKMLLGIGAASNEGAHIRAGNVNAGQGKPVKCFNCNGLRHITRNCTQPKHQQNSNYFKDKMVLMQAQENGAVLDEEELLFLTREQINNFDADVDDHPVRDLALNDDNIFQEDKCDAFDSDVDDEPTAQSIFMAKLSSHGLTNQQAGPSNASILYEVHDLENAIDLCDDNQDEHEIYNEVQQKNIIDSTRDHIVTELNIYKEQVAIYKQSAKFELTLPEQKIDEQMSILIRDCNQKEENIKKELHSAKRAQPTLYDVNELLKTHHVPVLVISSGEDLELAETTRIKMNDYVCVEKRVKVTPPNYSKENFMATFTPQTQLTREQVFWSKEINDKMDDDLKARTLPLLVLLPATMAMKAVFENLEAEVDQNEIDLKSGEIKQKSLLIPNENLIANCIAQDVFSTVTDSAMTAS
uniref:Retrovirus-related Pol polyprotein from transposon TNT 1-94 n=1 Tax=Tanacetum cinerariifolium TaxID=118510 RepID=A0A699GQ63_TANCI|nr:retrovirus-related Pol polyprotein from transposon TNT 1-94 [Tanacetum cinerariifolium]